MMRESEAWRMLEKAWRNADPNRPRGRWVNTEDETVRYGLCYSVYRVTNGDDALLHGMRNRVGGIPVVDRTEKLQYDYDWFFWPLTGEYDSVRADWCAKFAEQCEKEEQEA